MRFAPWAKWHSDSSCALVHKMFTKLGTGPPHGGKSVGIYNPSSKSALNLSVPLMLTYGLGDYEGNQRYELTLQFPDRGSNAKLDTLLDNLIAFEERIKADAVKNAKEWFGKPKMTPDVVEALWTPMLKYRKDKDTGEFDMTRAPTLRVKAPFYADTNKWDCEVYDVNNERLFPDPDTSLTPLDYLKKGTQAGLLIKCGGLWFANGKFGVTWRLLQAKIRPRTTITGTCQIALDEDDVATMQKTSDDTSDAGDDVPPQWYNQMMRRRRRRRKHQLLNLNLKSRRRR